jgi:hypothetical protein
MRDIVCGLALLVLSAGASGQLGQAVTAPAIPAAATLLQGSPTVQVETTIDGTKRHTLTASEANAHGLSISVNDGRYFWTSRQNEELTPTTSGEFIYLTSGTPGQYVRLRRVNDRLTYIEHLDMGARTVTYFGELRIVLGR